MNFVKYFQKVDPTWTQCIESSLMSDKIYNIKKILTIHFCLALGAHAIGISTRVSLTLSTFLLANGLCVSDC